MLIKGFHCYHQWSAVCKRTTVSNRPSPDGTDLVIWWSMTRRTTCEDSLSRVFLSHVLEKQKECFVFLFVTGLCIDMNVIKIHIQSWIKRNCTYAVVGEALNTLVWVGNTKEWNYRALESSLFIGKRKGDYVLSSMDAGCWMCNGARFQRAMAVKLLSLVVSSLLYRQRTYCEYNIFAGWWI